MIQKALGRRGSLRFSVLVLTVSSDTVREARTSRRMDIRRLLFQAALSICYLSTVLGGSPKAKFSFLREASSAAANELYDYVIVGGGTAGCPLAATLSEKFKVLLLERGGAPYGNPNIERIELFVNNLEQCDETSPAQAFVSEDGVANRRARVLGGGTCLNAGFYSRASKEFIQKAGWEPGIVDASYAWVERVVTFVPELKKWQSAFRKGLLEAEVVPDNGVTYEHAVGTKTGGSIFDSHGYRHTAADLLEYANPQNINVLLHATVKQILFRKGDGRSPRAYGVVYTDSSGAEHRALLNSHPRSEVIVSSGALGSPQLLLLSGVGPKQHLEAFEIPLVLDSPNVGQGMADNPMNAIFVPSPTPLEISLVEVVGVTEFGSFIESASARNVTGMIVSPAAGMISSVPPSLRTQDLIESVRSQLEDMASEAASYLPRTGVLMEKVDGPLSTGYLRLRNTNINDNPTVRFNYFAEQVDLDKCIRGIQTMERLLASPAMTEFRYMDFRQIPEPMLKLIKLFGNLLPKNTSDTIKLGTFCKETVLTIWHYHGGCQVGRVVDQSHRVMGVDKLRVIDGSTFLTSPGTNPQATVMMLGRYMGLQMLKERGMDK